MPTATPVTLTEDQIDDLLYLARTSETTDLRSSIEELANNLSSQSANIIAAVVDQHSGNGLLHMASANGHTETLKTLLSLASPSNAQRTSSVSILNLQNHSGNTPLHWAALNGHLEAVKALIAAGADLHVENKACNDALGEALIANRDISEWSLEGKGTEQVLDDKVEDKVLVRDGDVVE